MKNQSKKERIPASQKKNIGQGKNIKRSKSTEHLGTKKSVKKNQMERQHSDQTLINSFAKSKSMKSIKSKQKSLYKNQLSCKKGKVGRLMSPTKTVKKVKQRQSHEISSILTEDWQIKKQSNQFFFYCNNYIPIENSAQRRLVYKIQMIDEEQKNFQENKETASTFCKMVGEDKEIQTQQVQKEEIGVGGVVCEVKENYMQTQRNSYDEQKDKCFADVLTQLQFLYMPNQSNFEPFSEEQRTHYGQLLESLAKKILAGKKNIIVENYLTEDQVTVLMYQREGIQVGALEYIPAEGFPTHLLAILAYLKNLFCFIDYNYKEEVIANLRAFYGLNYNQRVEKISRRQPHEKDNRNVLTEQIFEIFQHEMFKDYDFGNEVMKEAVHTHNKAIFDVVNAQLQSFRPFFSSEGQPFPWTINLGMTHYDITQQALYIIFMQVKDKIQKMVTTLCGMHLDFDDKELPDHNKSEFYKKKTNEKIDKTTIEEMKTYDDRVEVDYERTMLNFQIEEEIFFELINEVEREIVEMENPASQDWDFQFF